jgi:phosphate-selective porin OprO and OprP
LDIPLIKNFQLGGSFAYARLDTSDLNVDIDTPGRTTFFEVNSRAKFRVIQDVDDRRRFGFEMAYACGPLVLMGEYIRNDYHELLLSDDEMFDFSMKGWYAGMLLMLTGEKPVISRGVLQKIKPKQNFDIKERKWGAWGIGFRYEQFEADQVVYDELVFEGQSVRRANSFTAALNWYLNSMVRFSLNYSRTTFAQPLFLGTSPEGYSYYRDTENVWLTRFQLEF